MRKSAEKRAKSGIDPDCDHSDRDQHEAKLLGVHRRPAGGHGPPAEPSPHGQTVGMGDAFPIVIIGVSIAAIVVAVLVTVASRGMYDRIGRGAFSLDTPDRMRGPEPGTAAARSEATEEIRQLVEAKSARRVARGEAPLDVDAEVAALTQTAPPAADAELREEIRSHVIARNERRMARGREP